MPNRWTDGEAGQYLRTVFDLNPLPTFIVDKDVRIRDYNRAAERLLDRDLRLVLNQSAGEALHCLHAEAKGCGYSEPCRDCVVRDSVKRALSGGETHRRMHEATLRDGDKTVRTHLLVSATPLAQGESPTTLLILEDVSELLALRGFALKTENRCRALVEMSPDAVLVYRDERIAFANPAAFRILGASAPEHLLGKTALELVHPDFHPQLLNRNRLLLTGEPIPLLEEKVVRMDGRALDVEVAICPFEDEGGRAVQVILRDITERKLFAERLRQAQKMESIGHLAGGMAHEFNNILAAMMMNLDLAQMNSGTASNGPLQEMEGLCKRAADLIGQLLAFSRRSMMQLRPVNLGASLLEHSKMLNRLLGERITVEFSIADNLPWVNADPMMIEKVLLNLCLNAQDAMNGSGSLSIGLSKKEIDAEQAKAHENAHPGTYVCLSVRDAGCGMDEKTMRRLFEPFFTTKGVGKGPGLGLATVRGIVQQHRGWVEVESCLGKGSLFRVHLPALPIAPVSSAGS
jgi:PAS domain S-box-containing protein